MSQIRSNVTPHLLPLGAALVILLAAHLPTLQTIPNGSEHYYMIDVGETQIVLNVWGTLHATGYPLYVILGNLLTTLLKLLGINAVTAPAVVSLLWGIVGFILLYVLLARLTRRPALAALALILLGLTRTVWIHQVIAEIYSFGFAILVALLLLALWEPPVRHRIYWLALLGGIGVSHHRAIAMMIPALLYATYDDFRQQGRRLPVTLLICLLLGLIGFLPYLYLPLRENANGMWVYGEPGTLAGLWDQFTGREAARFIGSPGSLEGIAANFGTITQVLITDLTLPGLLAGLAGLAFGLTLTDRRRLALTMILNAAVAYLFHGFFYTDILSALILPVLVSAASGWLLLAEAVLERVEASRLGLRVVQAAVGISALGLGVALYQPNAPFIAQLTQDQTGVETIRLAENAPTDSTLMLAWGPRHFAVGIARDVEGRLQDLMLVDHKVNLSEIARSQRLITPEYTFYRQPVSWWQEQLGMPVYLRSAAPFLVEVATDPVLTSGNTLEARNPLVSCAQDALHLQVDWFTPTVPERDYSVFVHLLAEDGQLVAQADQNAPVYGWRPMTTWQAGEIVRDVYPLPRSEDADTIAFGLYTSRPDGSFENILEYRIPVECEA